MTYRGKVMNGVVVFDGAVSPSDGTIVRVEPIEPGCVDASPEGLSSLFRASERARGTGIPDLAINHDHYLYGHPKVTDG